LGASWVERAFSRVGGWRAISQRIATMESVRSPSWYDALVFASSVVEDPDVLIELVEKAPPAFNDTAPTGNALAF
jgi:hypothetical protein